MAETATSSYVVLRQVFTNHAEYPTSWVELKTVSARSQEEAIKAAADTTTGATYAAIPARSWSPLSVVPKTVTTFALEEVVAPATPAVEATP